MRKFDRVIIIVLDSVGAGELPDAENYGDAGSNTLGNTARAVGGMRLPNLGELGLGNITEIMGVPGIKDAKGSYGKMAEASAGKDTTTGHWEMAGILTETPFPTYPDGFPEEVTGPFVEAIGTGILGNKPASGTEIIVELGEEHMRTGRPIVYTSADSVFQIAAHKDVIPLSRLYEMCETARALLTGRHGVGRVIARPFTGSPGGFTRTHERRDYSLAPPSETLLDIAKAAGLDVVGVGKIEDIFAGRGLTEPVHTTGNTDGLAWTLEVVQRVKEGIIMVNLVDFDMLYGHRNDPDGYYEALREFDAWLPELTGMLGPRDIMFITADHGCDPTTPSTDHSREYAPLIVYGPALVPGTDLGIRETFSDLGATVADALGLKITRGTSFLKDITA